ncbi:MAG: AAA family ATPase [Gracilibacteraceae bacterium]|jgi:stage V sporulation protein K|nr:AAA family ATPase [Gracilibacteraceae bacterium]
MNYCDDPRMLIEIEKFDLSLRAYNSLKRGNIETVADILRLGENGLIKVRNLGRRSLCEVKEKLKQMGITLEAEPLQTGEIKTCVVVSAADLEEYIQRKLEDVLKSDAAIKAEITFMRGYFQPGKYCVNFSYLIDGRDPCVSALIASYLRAKYCDISGSMRDYNISRDIDKLNFPEEDEYDEYRHNTDITACERITELPKSMFDAMLRAVAAKVDIHRVFIGNITDCPLSLERIRLLSETIHLRRFDANAVHFDEAALIPAILDKFGYIADDLRTKYTEYRDANINMPISERMARFVHRRMFSSWECEIPEAAEPREITETARVMKPTALDRLGGMIGLPGVKSTVRNLTAHCAIRKMKADLAGAPETIVPNMLFLGNPGTGKTTVAKLVAEVLREHGLMRKGHLVTAARADLIGRHTGETAPKTTERFVLALDGVFFIDEAYSLYNGEEDDQDIFGKEAIDALTGLMTEYAGRCCVILAGYEDEVEQMLRRVNPGLRERFPFRLKFEDYTELELKQIFLSKTAEQQLRLTDGCDIALDNLLHRLYASRGRDFSNGRAVQNALQEVVLQQERRLFETQNRGTALTAEEVFDLTAEDFRAAGGELLKRNVQTAEKARIGFSAA